MKGFLVGEEKKPRHTHTHIYPLYGMHKIKKESITGHNLRKVGMETKILFFAAFSPPPLPPP
jgi:hypothetical protein